MIRTLALVLIAAPHMFAQDTTLAAGPWSGQAQCVLVAKGADYQEEQTHTWRLTGAPPKPEGVFQVWPATWIVQGRGRRVLASALESREATREKPSEQWTISAEMSAPLSIWALAGKADRLRIGSRHGQLSGPLGSIQVTPSVGRPIFSTQQEWQFPVVEDRAASTTLTGTSTRTLPEGFMFGWRQPRTVTTNETCTWTFVRGGGVVTGRGRGSFSNTTSPTPLPRAIAMTGFTAAGAAATVPPRAIVMNGFTATGSSAIVPPRAIAMPGFSAVGANATGRGGRKE